MRTRRTLLRGGPLAGVGTLLAACGTPSPGSVSVAVPTSAAAQAKSVAPPTATGGATLVFGASAEARTLNPLLASDGASTSVWERLFEPLVRPDPKTGNPVPGLAERWDQSADGTTVTVHMRPGVTWSDGQPLTADDAKFTFDT